MKEVCQRTVRLVLSECKMVLTGEAGQGHWCKRCAHVRSNRFAMALSPKPSTLSLGQKLWNALSAWTIKASGYQKLGKKLSDSVDET